MVTTSQTQVWEVAAVTAEASEAELIWAPHLPGARVLLCSGLQSHVDHLPGRRDSGTDQGAHWLARQAQQLPYLQGGPLSDSLGTFPLSSAT